jgi:hypothetical protein
MTAAPEPTPAPTYSPPPAPPRKRSTLKIVLIVVAAVVAVFIALIIGLFVLVNESTEDAQKVSDDLVTAVQAGDGPKAYALAGPAFREATTEADMTAIVEQLAPLVTKDKASPSGKAINASTENGKIAVFTYTLKGSSGGSIYFKTQIRDEDGSWKVMNFRSSETELDTEVE